MNNPIPSNQRDLAVPMGVSVKMPGTQTGPPRREQFPDGLLTPGDVARLLQVPRSWVYERTRERSRDRLPGFRLGKYWRFRLPDVLAWLELQRQEGMG